LNFLINMLVRYHRDRTEIVQHSAYRGSSHRHNGATSHIIDKTFFGYFVCLFYWEGRGAFTCPW
jgi:hypothetical protein